MRVKPLDDVGLEAVVKVPWWESEHPDPTIESNKDAYLEACERMKEAITSELSIQRTLFQPLTSRGNVPSFFRFRKYANGVIKNSAGQY